MTNARIHTAFVASSVSTDRYNLAEHVFLPLSLPLKLKLKLYNSFFQTYKSSSITSRVPAISLYPILPFFLLLHLQQQSAVYVW